MSGKVTADGLDVITERSGHVIAPVTPSVCLTPAAPSPMPVPYPVTGSSGEGIAGAPSRTKINGARIGTVGSAFTASHGNEPGALKEVVSHNTAGPAPLLIGAPNVWIERGMAGITGSPVMSNKSPGSTTRTAPAPQLGAGMSFGTAVLGGGTGGGGADGDAAGGGDGADGAAGGNGGQNAAGDGRSAPAGQDGQCADGHPVDVITGRAYTLPAVELELPGPLPLVFARAYSTTAAQRDVGLGFGWSHTWSWEIEVKRRALVVWSDEGVAVDFAPVEIGAEVMGPWGWVLRRERERFVLDKGDGVSRVFAAVDEAGTRWKLIELRDRNGNRIELTYDAEGRLAEVTDSVGRMVAIECTRAGRIASVQVHNARARGRWIAVARYGYDEAGDLAAAFDAEGHVARYAYDDEHRLVCETDRTGLAFRFVYDRAGRCVETWGEYPGKRDASLAEGLPAKLADGRTRARGVHHVRLDYGADRYTEVADSREVRRYFGNRHGLVEKAVEGGGVVTAAYDARGRLVARMDAMEAVTRYVRDARGEVVRVEDPLGRVTTYERDCDGLVTKIIDPSEGVYTLQRDEHGDVLHEADPVGATTSYAYDARGLVTAITSPTGGVTGFAYDAEGNVVEQTAPNGARWHWAYDVLGRRVQEIDPLGNETRWTWTARGDVAAVFHADGGVTRYTYDGERRRTEIQGSGQRTVGLAWGGFHKLVAATRPDGQVARARYNREGELLEVENELGEIHRLSRNGAGLVVGEETFDGRTIAYRYDKARRIVRVEAAGEITERTYNAAGELTTRTLSDETAESFSYNPRGELVRAVWPDGEVRFERDAAGRVVGEMQAFGGEEHAVASLHDQAGRRVRRVTSRGHVEQIERDGTGARARTILDELHDVGHARDAFGRETLRALPRGGRILHAYDPMGRAARRWSTASGSLRPVRFDDAGWAGGAAAAQPDRVTAEHEYKYDAEGELSDALDRRRGWTQYAYDAAGHLLSALGEATGREERFHYDAAGNPHEVGARSPAREYGPGGRLLRHGEVAYAWDEAGRLREKREGAHAHRYAWDAAGRLSGVVLPDGRRAEYAYDPLGRRVDACVLSAGTASARPTVEERTRFIWDGDTIAHAIRTRAVAGGDPVVEERTFCFEDGGFVPWAQCDDAPDGYGGRRKGWTFFVNDPIGTPEELVDGAGGVVAELDREVWGKTQALDDARVQTPLRFQGQYDDGETGLFYNRFRYYDAAAGLYISADPIGLDGGLRLFGYVPNTTGWIDPFGLARLPQDVRAKPLPPDPKDTRRPIGRSPQQNAACQADVAAALANGAEDIRVNQQQVDVSGQRVGINVPDLQYTDTRSDPNQRVYTEYDRPTSNRGPLHEQRIVDNDPNAKVILKTIP
jgi:RHS repeat-associated protein